MKGLLFMQPWEHNNATKAGKSSNLKMGLNEHNPFHIKGTAHQHIRMSAPRILAHIPNDEKQMHTKMQENQSYYFGKQQDSY